MFGMKRRDFITLLSAGAVAWPLAAGAQPGERVRKIGILVPAALGTAQWQSYLVAFREGLGRLGWSDDRNVRIDERWGADAEELRNGAAGLVEITPDVILAAAASASLPMLQATRTIPIVFANVPDPVANGFVTNLARPGGNITGFANYEPKIAVKWLELLKQIAPRTARVAFIYDPSNPTAPAYLRETSAAATSFGVEVQGAAVRQTEDIERVIPAFAREPNGGLIVASGPTTTSHLPLVIALAGRSHLPAVYPRSAASYVDRILKGERPGDLPVQFATKFELGLDPNVQLLARFDEVIE